MAVFMSAFPDQSLKKVEKDGSDPKVRTKMANMEVGGEADRDEQDEGEVLQTRVECVFLSDWALQGGSERISGVLAKTVEGWRADGRFATRLKGEYALSCLWLGNLHKRIRLRKPLV